VPESRLGWRTCQESRHDVFTMAPDTCPDPLAWSPNTHPGPLDQIPRQKMNTTKQGSQESGLWPCRRKWPEYPQVHSARRARYAMATQPAAERVESILVNLIQDSGIRAVNLFGPWGTGKTFVVSEFFKKRNTTELLSSHKFRFAYASFFGLNSILEAKQQLCLAALADPDKRGLSLFKKATSAIPTTVEVGGISLDLASLGSLATNYVEDQALRDLVVCIDDLERAPESLKMRDILGFISELTERRGCKCVVIYNRDRLTAEQKAVIDDQHEKVFDLSIEFKPTAAENAPIGIGRVEWRRIAEPVFAAFQNANIRIMKRFEWLVRTLLPLIPATAKSVLPEIVQHAAILTIIKHAHSDVIRDLSLVYRPSGASAAMIKTLMGTPSTRGQVPSPFQGYLDDLGYVIAAYDGDLDSLLTTGFIDPASLREHAGEEAEKAKRLKTEAELGKLWDDLRAGFVLDPELYTTRIKRFLKKQTHLRPIDYIDVCNLLLAIDPSENNTRLVVQKIGPAIKGIPTNRRAEAFRSFAYLKASKIFEQVPEVRSTKGPSIAEVIKSLAGSESSWDPSQYQALETFSDDEIISELTTKRGNDAVLRLRRLVERLDATAVGNAKALKPRLQAITERISNINLVTRFQVDMYIKRVDEALK